jgi:very-short-patch-repair endonuclease
MHKYNQLYNNKDLKEFRRRLRKNLTPAEATLWKSLKNRQVDGRRFRRQFSVGNYILDFYCPEEKLAIELDGQGHYTIWGAIRDDERSAFLNKQGIKVIRFENIVVFEDMESVLEEIRRNFGKIRADLDKED